MQHVCGKPKSTISRIFCSSFVGVLRWKQMVHHACNCCPRESLFVLVSRHFALGVLKKNELGSCCQFAESCPNSMAFTRVLLCVRIRFQKRSKTFSSISLSSFVVPSHPNGVLDQHLPVNLSLFEICLRRTRRRGTCLSPCSRRLCSTEREGREVAYLGGARA